ncbi:MAG: hypothetical protein QM487_14300 [Candidatus Marithrix sp.]
MKRKNSTISLIGLVSEMRQVLVAVEHIWNSYSKEAVITAGTEAFDGNDFIHSVGSLHPFGKALDFRINYFKDSNDKIDRLLINIIASKLRAELGNDYDVICHSTHIHIEYDPK